MTQLIHRKPAWTPTTAMPSTGAFEGHSLFEESAGGICISGDSGTGKSVLLRQIINNAIRAGDQAVFVFDPGGDLAKDVFSDCLHYGGSVIQRTHYFAPADDKVPVGPIHPLMAHRMPDDSDLRHMNRTECRIMHSAMILLAAWGDENFDQKPLLFKWLTMLLRSAAYLGLSLADIVHFFDIGSELYHVLTQSILNEVDRREFARLAELNVGDQEQAISSTKNRVQGLLAAPVMRMHLGVTKNTIDVQQLIEQRAIVIVDLETLDQISTEHQSLIANFWLTELFHTIFGTPAERRLPALIVCDELPIFRASAPMIARSLRLIRKTRARFVGSFQGMHSFPKGKDDPLLRNMVQCRTRFYFRHNDEDDANFFGGIVSLPQYDPMLGKFEHWEDQQYQDGNEEITLIDRSFNQAYSEGQSSTISTGESEGVNATVAVGESQTKSEGQSETQTQTEGETETESVSIGEGEKVSEGTTHSEGTTISDGQTKTHEQSRSESETTGEVKTESTERSVSDGRSVTDSVVDTDGHSSAIGGSKSRTATTGSNDAVNSGNSMTRTRELPDLIDKTRAASVNTGATHANQKSDSNATTVTNNEVDSNSTAIGQSKANTSTSTHSQGTSTANSKTKGTTVGIAEGVAEAHAVAIASSEARSISVAKSTNVNRSKGGSKHTSKGVSASKSSATAEQKSRTVSNGTSKSVDRSKSDGTSQSQSSGISLTYKTQRVPVIKWRKVLAFKEFFSSIEQKHRVASRIAAQSTGQSMMMIGGVGSCQVNIGMLKDHWKGQPKSLQAAKARYFEAFGNLPICHDANELFASLELREAKAEMLRVRLEMETQALRADNSILHIERDELPPESGIQI